MHSTVTLHTKHKFPPVARKRMASHPDQGHLERSGYPDAIYFAKFPLECHKGMTAAS